ncbi:MerR family transcriptional regulator [bacterium]|nr:MerR family transcriptional regulator [candidate division CSSED10-310 bacterium]
MNESRNRLVRIGEVSRILDIPAYVLRYWETEFPELQPTKSASGQRLYSDRDIDMIRQIAQLRYDEKLTLSGTKRKLKNSELPAPSQDLIKSLRNVKNSLQEILADLR